jgi:hypothetical protein
MDIKREDLRYRIMEFLFSALIKKQPPVSAQVPFGLVSRTDLITVIESPLGKNSGPGKHPQKPTLRCSFNAASVNFIGKSQNKRISRPNAGARGLLHIFQILVLMRVTTAFVMEESCSDKSLLREQVVELL